MPSSQRLNNSNIIQENKNSFHSKLFIKVTVFFSFPGSFSLFIVPAVYCCVSCLWSEVTGRPSLSFFQFLGKTTISATLLAGLPPRDDVTTPAPVSSSKSSHVEKPSSSEQISRRSVSPQRRQSECYNWNGIWMFWFVWGLSTVDESHQLNTKPNTYYVQIMNSLIC